MSFLAFSRSTSKQRQSTKANARLASDLLRAMSHDGRLLVLCLLAEGEASVSEIEAKLEARQPSVSQHLQRLKFDGLVKSRRDGRNIYYELARPEVKDLIGALDDIFCQSYRRSGLGRN
jgi:DNA-binding transcriptional ArsR family regulator